MPARTRAVVDVIGALLLLLPSCFLLVYTSIPFIRTSLAVWEGSPDPGGLPARYLLKMAIPAGFILLALQGVSQLVKDLAVFRGKELAS
jgi:TRAP-type mannitol/chloroaromatic compound transport system permease small subunit